MQGASNKIMWIIQSLQLTQWKLMYKRLDLDFPRQTYGKESGLISILSGALDQR